MENYFVYEHWRKDLNECFYVGIGKTPNPKKVKGYKTKYSRAFEKSKRSEYWKNIEKKTEYEIKIVFESNFKKEVCQKEIELIKLYGRKAYDNNGTLVNFDVGGNLSTCPKTRILEVLQIDKFSKKVLKVWKQIKDIQNELGYLKTNIVKCCKNKQRTAYGFIWQYANVDYTNSYATSARKKSSIRGVGINIYDKNYNFLEKLRTREEIKQKYNLKITTIHNMLHGKVKNKDYIIEYDTWKNAH